MIDLTGLLSPRGSTSSITVPPGISAKHTVTCWTGSDTGSVTLTGENIGTRNSSR